MGYGVIGSTSDSGSFSLGSSPGTPAYFSDLPPLCSGLARRPLKAVAPVRIRSGVHREEALRFGGGPLSSPRRGLRALSRHSTPKRRKDSSASASRRRLSSTGS